MKLSEKLYQINAYISGHYITGIRKPTVDDMSQINMAIGEIIKELREMEENNHIMNKKLLKEYSSRQRI